MNNKKAQERIIEKQIAAIKCQLNRLTPRASGGLSSKFMIAYNADLPRRLGLERSFEMRRRQFNALRYAPAFEPELALAS